MILPLSSFRDSRLARGIRNAARDSLRNATSVLGDSNFLLEYAQSRPLLSRFPPKVAETYGKKRPSNHRGLLGLLESI